jgi:hypothetical protein
MNCEGSHSGSGGSKPSIGSKRSIGTNRSGTVVEKDASPSSK